MGFGGINPMMDRPFSGNANEILEEFLYIMQVGIAMDTIITALAH